MYLDSKTSDRQILQKQRKDTLVNVFQKSNI